MGRVHKNSGSSSDLSEAWNGTGIYIELSAYAEKRAAWELMKDLQLVIREEPPRFYIVGSSIPQEMMVNAKSIFWLTKKILMRLEKRGEHIQDCLDKHRQIQPVPDSLKRGFEVPDQFMETTAVGGI